ncbi:MAG: DNA polymerase III subunit alpha [Firmicutes bacterium]|nr:DNA polymerase III subunit alpha [Bacillota bacterium]
MFVHLHVHSYFSMLDGASSVESLVAQAAAHGMPALALTDHNTVAGLAQLHHWCAVYGIKPISGAELTLHDGSHLTVLAKTPTGYENLCRLLTAAYATEAWRRERIVRVPDLLPYTEGLIALSGCRRGQLTKQIIQRRYAEAKRIATFYAQAFAGRYYIELLGDDWPHTERINADLADLGEALGLPLVASANVHYHTPALLPVHDTLRCIATDCDIRTPHGERPLNAAAWLHDEREAARRFARYPEAVANTFRIATSCEVVLRLHEALFPAFDLPSDETDAAAYLRHLVYEGAVQRYPRVDHALRARIDHELQIITQLGYAEYFLVVWDIVRFARRRGIRCAGRGSAADSAAAYCLYITDVDAAGRGLLFERFMSIERSERPDIDIDFDARRRDEVIAYIYDKYGAQHVARVATYQTFRGRSAIREVGAALALPSSLIDTLAKRLPYYVGAQDIEQALDHVPELAPYKSYQDRLKWLWQLSAQITGFPRHFGMHVGGVVISRKPILSLTTLQPSAKGDLIIPWDKEDVEMVGLVKLDILSLRTMSAISDTITLRAQQQQPLDYDAIALDDQATFEMINRGETIGVFQLESPAQRALQARLGADQLEDIVASVALIRPGPVKGNMVDPFVSRRRGVEEIQYLHPKLEPILGKTYGVILYQEQVIAIATSLAQFTPGEADQLRRVMSHARSAEHMDHIGAQFIAKAVQAGVDTHTASQVFAMMKGYASYGFCEAHAAAFATTAYKTAYLVRHYPAEFYAAILNNHPMGYYPIHVVCAEAQRRGVALLGVDCNASDYACTVEEGKIRLGFRLIKGMRKELAEQLQLAREAGPFHSIPALLQRVPSIDPLLAERFIRCGALDSIEPRGRRLALWQLPVWLAARDSLATSLWGDTAGKWSSQETIEAEVSDFSLAEKLRDEYSLLGVGVSGHWLRLYRASLNEQGYTTTQAIDALVDGVTVSLAGLTIRPHRPPTRSGLVTVFFTIEDETGFADCTMFEHVYQESGAVLFTPRGRLVGVTGRVDRRGGQRPQIIVEQVWSLA